MSAVAKDIAAMENVALATLGTTPIVTTLYDLITALNDEIEPREEVMVTDAVVHLCNTGKLHFLRITGDCEVVCG